MLEEQIHGLLSTWGAMSTWDIADSITRAGLSVSVAEVQAALEACAKQSADRTDGQRLWTLRAGEGRCVPNQSRASESVGGEDVPAMCPVCGGSMVLRFAGRGKQADRVFLGCAKFPRCRGSLPAPDSVQQPPEPTRPTTPTRPVASAVAPAPARTDPASSGWATALPAPRAEATPRFVRDPEWGLGRYDAVRREAHFFDSPAAPEITVPVAGRGLRGVALAPQERAWWHDGERWTVGRIGAVHDGGDSYSVFFPNGLTKRVAAEELRVRWNRPIADPMGLLVAGTVETRFFHTHRARFLRAVAAERGACLGLRGLASAGVQIHEHQIGAARRVLSDPVPRYLLADEVGMGKTIEAGLVLRQLMLDDPGVCTVVVPDRLVGQWRNELDSKFRIRDVRGAVEIVGHSDVEDLEHEDRSLVIVDEAHRFCEGVRYGNGDTADRRYQAVRHAAHRSKALLLLSATPVRSNEDAFLGLLHLLDPQNYPLDDVDGFRRRVAIRDDLAETMSALGEETPVRYLAEPLTSVVRLLGGDRVVADAANEALQCIEARSFDEAREHVATLRVHVSEAYRLHRRMIRNRRPAVAHQDFPVRGRCRADEWTLADPDPRRADVFQAVESFRGNLGAYEVENAGALLRIVLGRALGPVESLRDLTVALRSRRGHDLDHREAALVAQMTGTVWGETLCEELEALLGRDADRTRISAAVEWARKRINRGKFAIACSHPRTARLVYEAIQAAVGAHRVSALLEDQDEEQCSARVAEFEAKSDQNILVMDRSAEEGVNLQFVESILHLNLPTTTSSLEQRIGRIDRWSRLPRPAGSVVFVEADGLREDHLGAWLHLLDRVFGIFETSTATLQYAIADVEDAFFANAVGDTFASARERMESQSTDLELMRRRIVGQDSLDSIEDRTEDKDLAASLRRLDAESSILGRALRDYVVDMLKFASFTEDGLVRFNIKKAEPPLVTEAVVKGLGAKLDRRYTTDRSRASANVGMIRWGEPLVDAFAAYARIDDRGLAFAIEATRKGADPDQDPWIAFCFDFVVRPNLESIATADDAVTRAVRARAAMYLPEMNEQIWWMVGKGECPPELVHRLETEWGSGQNLGSRPDRFRQLTRTLDWASQCDNAIRKSLSRVSARQDVVRTLETARQRAAEAAGRERAILSVREVAREQGRLEQRVHEAVVAALAEPLFVLESCGAVFLTGQSTA